MKLDDVIAKLVELRSTVGGDAEVNAINVDENTAHPNDGGGCWPERSETFPIVNDNGTVKIGEWYEYYST